jgi:hypothetical protein
MLFSWGKHREGKQHPLGDWLKKPHYMFPPPPISFFACCFRIAVVILKGTEIIIYITGGKKEQLFGKIRNLRLETIRLPEK